MIFRNIPVWIIAVTFAVIGLLLTMSYLRGTPFFIHGKSWGFSHTTKQGSSFSSLNFTYFNPVVYSGNAKKSGNEYQLSNASKPSVYIVPVPNLPEGASIIGAWAVPYDNLENLSEFVSIHVEKEDGRNIKLVGRSTGKSGRIRLQISILYQNP